LYIRFIYLS
jgi:tetratricopeptide (TPR) repeat protein